MVLKTGSICLGLVGFFLAFGCSNSSPEPVANNVPTVTPTHTNVPVTPEPTTGGVPQGDLKKDQANYDAAKAAYGKDPKTKDAYVQATIKLATDTMGSNSLESKVKYPAALRLYREALKVDPTNKDAMDYKNLIEGIYKQMGRPVPQ